MIAEVIPRQLEDVIRVALYAEYSFRFGNEMQLASLV